MMDPHAKNWVISKVQRFAERERAKGDPVSLERANLADEIADSFRSDIPGD